MSGNLNDYLAAFETRAKAAMADTFDPERETLISEHEGAMAQQYLRDIGELTELVRKATRRRLEVEDLLRVISMNPKGGKRLTGRTTRMLLNGLVALSNGHSVLVIAHTCQYAGDLGRRLLREAAHFGIPLSEHWSPDGPPYVIAKGVNEPRTAFHGVTLIDHTVCGGDGRVEITEVEQ